jgi:hypothetical protein
MAFFHLLLPNTYIFRQEKLKTGHWWFLPVILATQEAEIRRTEV